MAGAPDIRFGILKCRDLVQLYYGARMVANIKETAFAASADPYLILAQDPRRIRYEVWWNPANVAATTAVSIGTPQAIDSGNAQQIDSEFTNSNPPLVRDFLTDMDAVCLPVMISDPAGTMIVTVRETFLTPIPIDEFP